MDEAEFKRRTKGVALCVTKLVDALPSSRSADVIGRQLLRSASLIGANYRAAYRSRSTADMISRLSMVEEEGDETLYWLLVESKKIAALRIKRLRNEVHEIVSMTVASIKTLRGRTVAVQNPKSKT